MSRTPSRRSPRKAPWVFVFALRLIVLSLAVQTGGVARDTADVVWAVALGVDAPDLDDDCLQDLGACHCPPGCPNCHCSHGVGSLPPPASEPLLIVASNTAELVAFGNVDSHDPRPFLDGVYRPPRAARALG